MGRIFDDAGNRMTPTHARKGGLKYRYYLSSALLHGRTDGAGSVTRVPAAEVEAVVVKSLREHIKTQRLIDDRVLVETHVDRVEVHADHLIIRLADKGESDDVARPESTLSITWRKTASTRKREILLPEGTPPQQPVRPIRL